MVEAQTTMLHATINGTDVTLPQGSKVIEAIFASGNYVPTLCALEGINDIGACRVCVVEVEGIERLVPACNTLLEDGMSILTDTPRVLEARRTNVSLLLSQHDVQCATCVRNGNCVLQSLAQELNILDVPYEKDVTETPWDKSFPLIRDSSKCVRCLRCVQVCHKVQGCDVWDIKNRATRLDVGVSDGLPIEEAGCTLCGQCITHCPTGALRARDDIDTVLEALADPDVVTTVQVAPAVRTSWGETLDLPNEAATEGRLAATFRALGFDYVFDTNFGADMTIMEEGSELLERLGGTGAMPMFTSCCPGWVRFLKANHPDKIAHLSSAKSPQQMFGALLKEYVGPKLGMVAPEDGARGDASVAATEMDSAMQKPMGKRIFNVSCMPCVAKKYEASIREMTRGNEPDVDAVLTVRELGRLIRLMHVNVAALDETPFDDPMNEGSGAAVIFGATGGVMEAALRSAYFLVNGVNPDPDAFVEVRGLDGWKEKSFDLGSKVRIAVASGLANAEKLLAAIDAGEVEYDFVEVMACPGGCAGGGGQPIHEAQELAGDRGQTLYALDRKRPTRFSHENPNVTTCYEEFLGKPLSHKAHELLHTNQEQWTL